jgi:TRAP-type mannitol/chloroaromatic compound transport system permease small subunit
MITNFIELVNRITEGIGNIARWLIVPITLIVVTEVVSRYFFNKPTIWAWDINTQLFGIFVILGGSYTFLHSSHIGIDVIVLKLPLKVQLSIRLITELLFFYSIGILLWKGSIAAWKSILIRETMSTYFKPPIYPFRVIVAIGVFLLLLQGINKFLIDLKKLLGNKG